MRILTTRRISQVFFCILFVWFCVVSTLGDQWWQLRGWPVNWLIQLDPLVGLATLLTTRTIYAGLWWSVVTIVLTLFLGRFFCGWVCPFGALHQLVGFLSRRHKPLRVRADLNRYRAAQIIKYWILIFLLSAALGDMLRDVALLPHRHLWLTWMMIAVCSGALILTLRSWSGGSSPRMVGTIFGVTLAWLAVSYVFPGNRLFSASLQIGLLDPIPLFHRSINLMLFPLLDDSTINLSTAPRYYEGVWLIGAVFWIAVLLNVRIPRFYCRYICPLGALLGVLSRYAIWRIGKTEATCSGCLRCEKDCEGACAPSSEMRIHECVLCLNCLDVCRDGTIAYQTAPSAAGEMAAPDVSRRHFLMATVTGLAAVSMPPIGGIHHTNWNPAVVRPPGSLPEKTFLNRCIKCGQCMRVCPTNVIQPAALQSGWEGLWTPVLNFRIGTSGCQFKCIACGHICPTAAIRPIRLEERLGKNRYAGAGPIKIGTAFVDRGRCLPWAMDRPCIVCQENCPVSPKAIFTRRHDQPIHLPSPLVVSAATANTIDLNTNILIPDRFATGDYYCRIVGLNDQRLRPITANTDRQLTVATRKPWRELPTAGSRVELLIRLQRVYVDVEKCIGCGVCEHECPVAGRRAIRVTAENETRHRDHALVVS